MLDVAQLLLASVEGSSTFVRATAGSADGAASGGATATALLDRPGAPVDPAATKAEPEAGDVTQTEDTVTDPAEVGANAAAAQQEDPEAQAVAETPDAADAAESGGCDGHGGHGRRAQEGRRHPLLAPTHPRVFLWSTSGRAGRLSPFRVAVSGGENSPTERSQQADALTSRRRSLCTRRWDGSRKSDVIMALT